MPQIRSFVRLAFALFLGLPQWLTAQGAASALVLEPGDVLEVTVWKEKDLNCTCAVAENLRGRIPGTLLQSWWRPHRGCPRSPAFRAEDARWFFGRNGWPPNWWAGWLSPEVRGPSLYVAQHAGQIVVRWLGLAASLQTVCTAPAPRAVDPALATALTHAARLYSGSCRP